MEAPIVFPTDPSQHKIVYATKTITSLPKLSDNPPTIRPTNNSSDQNANLTSTNNNNEETSTIESSKNVMLAETTNEAYNMLNDGSYIDPPKVLQQEKSEEPIIENKEIVKEESEWIESDNKNTEDKKLIKLQSNIHLVDIKPSRNFVGFNHIVSIVFSTLILILALCCFLYNLKRKHE